MKRRQQQKQENITDRQKEIIDYILRFRYLTRPQLQLLLKRTSRDYIINLLNDLVEKHYLFRFYTKEFAAKPSEFCLEKGSISYLREKGISERILGRIYDEKTRSQAFRKHNIFLVTLYLSLIALVEKTSGRLNFYTKDDLHGMKYLPLPNPDAYFAITEKDGTIQRYFLDVFDDGKYMAKRIQQYLYYHMRKYWQNNAKKAFPEIILVFPTETIQKKAYKLLQKKLSADSPVFYISTWEKIQTLGMCREALQKAV